MELAYPNCKKVSVSGTGNLAFGGFGLFIRSAMLQAYYIVFFYLFLVFEKQPGSAGYGEGGNWAGIGGERYPPYMNPLSNGMLYGSENGGMSRRVR